jgi:predicted ATP-binding protein involved in virulence
MEPNKTNLEQVEHSYFYSLELEGINCFKDKQTLDLSDGNGNFSQWTIILGDNGTGKTTLLRVLDRMQPIDRSTISDEEVKFCPNYILKFRQNNFKENTRLTFIQNNKLKFSYSYVKDEINTCRFGVFDYEINTFLLSYGASRRMSKNPNISQKSENEDKITSLFDDSIELINAEEWYLQKDFAYTKSENGLKTKLKQQLDLIKSVLIDILPDVLDLRFKEIKTVSDKASLEVQINENEWVSLRDLSFGYQTLTALIVDIASKMMDKYPESDNPLAEPAIILIDEIDLHLHPKWQRLVIDSLSKHFPKAQFIASSHSPLIVQAAQDKNANIVVCKKDGDKVIIENNPDEVKGWRIDQILTSDLFDLNSSRSPETAIAYNKYISLKGKSDLSASENEEFKRLVPIVKEAFSETVLDEKLLKFTEKYLK